MSRDERPSKGPRYTVRTGNIITGGEISNSPMTNVGSYSANEQPAWLPQLRAELTRIRGLLEEGNDPTVSAEDLDDAIEAVRALESEAAIAQRSGQADAKGFRRRVRALIAILAPVGEIIGGFAALQAILQQHL